MTVIPHAEGVEESATLVMRDVKVPGVVRSIRDDQRSSVFGKGVWVVWLNQKALPTNCSHCHRLNTRDTHNNFQNHSGKVFFSCDNQGSEGEG